MRRTCLHPGPLLIGLAWFTLAVAANVHPAESIPDIRLTFDEPAENQWVRNSGTAPCRIEARGVERAARDSGGAIRITGPEGVRVYSRVFDEARNAGAFLFFCEFRSSPARPDAGARTLAVCPGLFLLRLDPESRGGNVSLFVWDSAGRLEPRVSGPRPEPDVWHQVVAVRTPTAAFLWIDGREYRRDRSAPGRGAAGPLIIGGNTEWSGPFAGLIDNVLFMPAALARRGIERLIWAGWTTGTVSPKASRKRFWRFPRDADSWKPRWGLQVRVSKDGLRLSGPSTGVLVCRALEIDLAPEEGVSIDMSAESGHAAEVVLLTEDGPVPTAVPLVPDGRMHTYFARPDPSGRKDSKRVLRVTGLMLRSFPAGAREVVLRRIALGARPSEPGRPVLEVFAPDRRIAGLDAPVDVALVLRNDGGSPLRVTAALTLPRGVEAAPSPRLQSPDIASGETWRARWRLRSSQPVSGIVGLSVTADGRKVLAGECRVCFAADPTAAARSEAARRRWLSEGFPRVLDFRHLGPGCLTWFEGCTALLVDMIGDKIEAAREFKRRYPDRFVLMQINDEPNGVWGTWFCVPAESARKQGLRVRPEVFPSPSFRGWWLLDAGTVLLDDFPESVEEAEVRVREPDRLVRRVRGRKVLPDVLLYARAGDQPDWGQSEYASITAVDRDRGTVRIRRWPRSTGVQWFSYRAGKAVAAASSGDIYSLGEGKWIRTWVPNLTSNCPRDPDTGLDAAAWWARHYARVWRSQIARSAPHPDGFEFDWTSFRFFNVRADCNNDLAADGCEENGLSLWATGLHRFFRQLRSLLPPDALVLADSSNMMSQRSFGLLNGSENEEFLGFHSLAAFSTQYDLFRLWLERARAPRVSYLQSRFPCEWFTDDLTLTAAMRRSNFRGSNVARLGLAAACVGGGMHAYRTGLRRDIRTINTGGGPLRYDLDEYHAGRLYRRHWLGAPKGPARRLTGGMSDVLLPEPSWRDWTVEQGPGAGVVVLPPRVIPDDTSARGGESLLEVRVEAIRTVRPPLHAVRVVSPPARESVAAGEDVSVLFEVQGEWPADAPPEIREIPRGAGMRIVCGAAASPIFRFAVFPQWRKVWLTIPAPLAGRPRIELLCGDEPGVIRLRRLSLRRGSCDIFWREFEHGVVLVNAGHAAPFRFDLEALTPGRPWARLPGVRGLWPNTGEGVGRFVDVPPFDALFLIDAAIMDRAKLAPLPESVIVAVEPRPAP